MINKPPLFLKIWFMIHFAADIVFAIPLFIFPTKTLSFFGWNQIDPFTTRLVAAALFGIGIESLLSRNSTLESFNSLLTLKIIWSFSATLGILISIIQNAQNRPVFSWIVLFIFLLFNFLWTYWKVRIKKILNS